MKRQTGKKEDTRGLEKSLKDIAAMRDDDFLKESFKIVSFDPHDMTEKIIQFGKALLPQGEILYDYQEPFVYRTVYSLITSEGAQPTALFSRQSGKTEAVSFIIVTVMIIIPILAKLRDHDNEGTDIGARYPELDEFKTGVWVGLYSPQQLQVDTTYSRALNFIKNDSSVSVMEELDVAMATRSLNLTNGSMCVGQVCSKTSKIESKTWHLIILDEAQDSNDFVIMKSIEPMKSATNGTFVKTGSTGVDKNNFWDSIQTNRKEQRKFKDPRLNLHFESDYKAVIKGKRRAYDVTGKRKHLLWEIDVMDKLKRWGVQNEAFKLGYALVWAMETGMFITDSAYDRMINKRLGLVHTLKKEHKGWFICAGLDYGKDNNATVLTIGRSFYPKVDEFSTEPPHKQILCWIEIQGESYEYVHSTVMECIAHFGIEVIACDYTGVGKAPTDRIMFACGEAVKVIPVTFTRQSKSDMYFAWDNDIKANRFHVPANKETRDTAEYINFETQIKGLHKWYDGSFMVCEKGDGIDDRDDYCDSGALFVVAGNSEIEEESEVVEGNMFFDHTQPIYFTPGAAHW
jgi:hypothetical protein